MGFRGFTGGMRADMECGKVRQEMLDAMQVGYR